MKRPILALGLLCLAAALSACSNVSANPTSTDPTVSSAPSAPSGDTVTVTARDLKFSQSEVSLPAAKTIDLVFDNQDGAPHNVAIADASGNSVFRGDIVSSTKVTYHVPALAAGTYTFKCDVHPDMKGTITAR